MTDAKKNFLLSAAISPFVVALVPISGCNSHAPLTSAPGIKEIRVDQSCNITLSPFLGMMRHDDAVCHLESVHESQHLVEVLDHGKQERRVALVREQEYVLQDVTNEPVAFVVQEPVAKGWRIDSDPQPDQRKENLAVFRVYAQPGQIVRLHVGQQHLRDATGNDLFPSPPLNPGMPHPL